jgi:membrane-bound inhibitor of C-type lysozyme
MFTHTLLSAFLALLVFSSSSVIPPSLPSPPQNQDPSSPAHQAPRALPPEQQSDSHMIRAFRHLTYTCEGNSKLIVSLRGASARVVFKNHVYNLKQVDPPSGTKYSDESFVWWTKGDAAFLQDISSPDKYEMLSKDCRLQTSTLPPPTPAAKP